MNAHAPALADRESLALASDFTRGQRPWNCGPTNGGAPKEALRGFTGSDIIF